MTYRDVAAAMVAAGVLLHAVPAPAVNRDVNRILGEPEMKQRTATMGFKLFGGPPDKLEGMLKSEIAKWAEIAQRAGMTAK